MTTLKKTTKKYTTDEQYNMKADLWAKRIFPEMKYTDYKWVIEKAGEIYKHITAYFTANESLRAHTNALAMLINRYEPDSELANKYKVQTQKYRKTIENKKGEQDDVSYVPHNTILKMGNDIFQKAIRDPKNAKLNMVGMAILLNVLHPPMRKQIYDLPIVKEGSNIPENIENYTFRDTNGMWHIVVKQTQKKRINMNDDMVSADLSKIIDHSMKMYPRAYLISSWMTPNINISEGTIGQNLRDLEPALGTNVFRHSYVINFYEHKKTYNERANLARMMLHGVYCADMWYDTFKGNVVEEQKEPTGTPPKPTKPVPEQKEEKVDVPVEVEVIIERPKRKTQTEEEKKAKNRELKKIYREKNKVMLAKKRMEIYYKKKQEKK